MSSISSKPELRSPRHRRDQCLHAWAADGTYPWLHEATFSELRFFLYVLSEPTDAGYPYGPGIIPSGSFYKHEIVVSIRFPHTVSEPPSWEEIWGLLEPFRAKLSDLPIQPQGSHSVHPALRPISYAFVNDIRTLIARREAGLPPLLVPGLGDYPHVDGYFDAICDWWENERRLSGGHHYRGKPLHQERYNLRERFTAPEWRLALAQWRRYRISQFMPLERWNSGRWSLYEVPEEPVREEFEWRIRYD